MVFSDLEICLDFPGAEYSSVPTFVGSMSVTLPILFLEIVFDALVGMCLSIEALKIAVVLGDTLMSPHFG